MMTVEKSLEAPPLAATQGTELVEVARKKRVNIRGLMTSLVGLGLLALGLETASVLGPDAWGIPRSRRLVEGSFELMATDNFARAVFETVSAVVAATGLALVAGLAVGLLTGSSRFLSITLGAPLEIVRSIPALALIPVAILALGQGMTMEVTVAAFASWWPVLFNTAYGVRGIDSMRLDAARVMGINPIKRVWSVVIPSLTPFVLAGLRTAMPLTLIVVIAAEYLSTVQRGLGGVLIRATSTGEMEVLWCTAVVAGVLGVVMGLGLEGLQRVAVPWAEEKKS